MVRKGKIEIIVGSVRCGEVTENKEEDQHSPASVQWFVTVLYDHDESRNREQVFFWLIDFLISPTSDATTAGSAKNGCNHPGTKRILESDDPTNQFWASSRAPWNSTWQSPSPVGNGPHGGCNKCRLLAHASMMNLWVPAFLATKKCNVFSSSLKPDETSLHQITDKTHVVTLAVLENWINTARSIRCWYVSN